jgi:hypothetical protein
LVFQIGEQKYIKDMIQNTLSKIRHYYRKISLLSDKFWHKTLYITIGISATLWFLFRVVPKPARASYPCQKAAFPLATGFVIWMLSLFALSPLKNKVRKLFPQRIWLGSAMIVLIMSGFVIWTISIYSTESFAFKKDTYAGYNYVPSNPNEPKGIARGIFPGRVVWAHDPLAAKWAGNWKENSDQWWLDKNTDQQRVENMLAVTLKELTGTKKLKDSWNKIFKLYNTNIRGLKNKSYQEGEIVAIKVNLNNCESPNKVNNYSDESPQLVLAMVRQLVYEAKVPADKIVIYDARRFIAPYILTKVWGEFKDVRFVQSQAPKDEQPVNPAYGNHKGLEEVVWVEGVEYSLGTFDKARNIPKQIYEATYLINMALLKIHSYPYNDMEDGDEGQTGVTLCGKSHFGSIQAPWELHKKINPSDEAAKNAYSPLVDMASSPYLGKKTILYLLDGLYSGRKWRTYPSHFPNPPFNNKVEPYENNTWPASLLASIDGVALDCVGLDILYSQTKNNIDNAGKPRMIIRDNAEDYLLEMALANNPPSGTKYNQGGVQTNSLGVFEHWDNDLTRRYSRNIDPAKGKGIELVYLPL